jgi:hypothetical protein
MLKPLARTLIGVLIIGASLAVAAPANAALPAPNVKLIFPNAQTNLCLGVAAGDVTNGTPIIVWHCNNNTDQTWTADPQSDGSFLMRNGTNRNKCLSVGNMSKSNGAPMEIWDCKTPDQNADQRWFFRNSPLSTCTIFVNENSNRVMGVQGGATNEGAAVIQWDWLAHPDQQWCSGPAPVN